MTEQINNHIHVVTGPQPEPANGLAVTGLIFGIIGASFAWVPVLGIGAWLWLLPGGLMAGLALRNPYGRSTAIAACIVNGIGLAICLVYLVAFAAAVGAAQ